MKLMIVESPNKTKKIKAILGEGWEVAASVGHFRDLPPKELGVDTDFALTYEYTERGKATIDALKPRVARAEMVYIATDPDREGGRATMGEIMRLTGASRNTLKEHLAQLVDKRHLERHGTGKGSWYALP